MSSLILNIVLVLLIFVPMAYFMFSKPKNSEALKKINDLATQSGFRQKQNGHFLPVRSIQ